MPAKKIKESADDKKGGSALRVSVLRPYVCLENGTVVVFVLPKVPVKTKPTHMAFVGSYLAQIAV